MIQRQVILPARPERVWTELTDPLSASEWMGGRVEWELVPGGPARFDEHGGTSRHGRVEEVVPGERLRFRWWPVDEGADQSSEVTFNLKPDGEGTELTVTERRLSSVPSNTIASSSVSNGAWSEWDEKLLALWMYTIASAEVRI
jgi:uncharacterized protein YndB with AHSA1/START domain